MKANLIRLARVGLLSLLVTSTALANVDNVQVARKLLSDSLFSEAASLLVEYVNEHSDDAHAIHMLGLAEFGMENYREALRWFLISDNKDTTKALKAINANYMAQSYEYLGDLKNALAAYDVFLESQPDDETRHGAASIAYELGEYRRSLEYLDQISRSYPQVETVAFDRMRNLYHLGQIGEALEVAQKIQINKLDPENALELLYYQYNIALEQKNFRVAFERLEAILPRLSAPSREVWQQYIALAAQQGKGDKLLQQGERYLRAFGTDRTVMATLTSYLRNNFTTTAPSVMAKFSPLHDDFRRLYLRKLYAIGSHQELVKEVEQKAIADSDIVLMFVDSLGKLDRQSEALRYINISLSHARDTQERLALLNIKYDVIVTNQGDRLALSQEIYEQFPSGASYYNYLADLYAAGKYQDVVTLLQAKPYSGADAALVAYMEGNSALELRAYPTALAAYGRVKTEDNTLRLNTLHRTAYVYDTQGNMAEAIRFYRQALELAGDAPAIAQEIQNRIDSIQAAQLPKP